MARNSGKIKAKSSKYSRWIRLYADILADYRIGSMSAHTAWGWVRILLVADMHKDGDLPPISGIAYHLRMSVSDTEDLIDELVGLGFLDVINPGDQPTLRPHNWSGRQFRSDNADPTLKERVRRHRKNKLTVTAPLQTRYDDVTVTVFPSESVSGTSTEGKKYTCGTTKVSTHDDGVAVTEPHFHGRTLGTKNRTGGGKVRVHTTGGDA